MGPSPARRIAFQILQRVWAGEAYASDLLHARLAHRVDRADAALATELTMGVLRWQRLLDFLLQRHLDRPAERLDAEVLLSLRLGLYQMRFLDRVPARAAVSESVELTKMAGKRSAAAFVNAMLRKLAPEAKWENAKIENLLPSGMPEAERLGILQSHPSWLVEKWLAQFGSEQTSALLEANNRPARASCVVLDPLDLPSVSESLRAEGFNVTPGRWLKTAVTVSGANPSQAKALQDGRLSIQDETSHMVARLVDAQPGDIVLDLCAAPGGKTLVLARAVAATGLVIATDVHEHRLRAARERLGKAQVHNVFWLALDTTRDLPFSRPFPRVLLDAPCSGTGTLARNPEIRWRLQPGDLTLAHSRQAAMLGAALACMARGGRLVYATCSLEPEENELVIREVLSKEPGVRVVPAADTLRPYLKMGAESGSLFDGAGFFRAFPPASGTDGFFAAVLERT